MDFKPHIEKFAHRLAEVEAALSDPNVFDNQQKAQDLGIAKPSSMQPLMQLIHLA